MRPARGVRDPYARVLDWLARRDRSEREVRDKLREWGTAIEDAESILSKLTDKGLVDDRAFALKLAGYHDRHDPVGPPKLIQKMRKRGLDGDLAVEAAEPLRDLDYQRELALGLVLKRLPSLLPLAPEVRYRRLTGYLARRGFTSSVIGELCHPLLREDLSLEDYEHDS
jgi:regulatory protein